MDFEPEEKDLGVVNFNVIASILIYSTRVCVCQPYARVMVRVIPSLWSDFSHLFDWNTKQLFVLVVAHYQTRKNASSLHILILRALAFSALL